MPQIGRPESLDRNNQFNSVAISNKPKKNSELNLTRQERNEIEKKKQVLDKIQGTQVDPIYKKGPHNQIGKDEFLKLLSHQLQNQDPMNPMDQNKFAAELAQFSQLEQLTNLNNKFDKLGANGPTENKFFGASFLGREVVIKNSSIKLESDGAKANIMFSLEKPAFKVVARVFDSKSNLVGEVWKDQVGSGPQGVLWDGITMDKQAAAKGEYRISVKAWDQQGQEINAETKASGTVETVYFENGETILLVDGKKVFLRDVDSFHMSKEQQEQFQKAISQKSANTMIDGKPQISPTGEIAGNNGSFNQKIIKNDSARQMMNSDNLPVAKNVKNDLQSNLSAIQKYKKMDQ